MADGFGFKPGFTYPSAPNPNLYPQNSHLPHNNSYPPGTYPAAPLYSSPSAYPPSSYPPPPTHTPSIPPYAQSLFPPTSTYPPPPVNHSLPPTNYNPNYPHSGSNVSTGGQKAYYWIDWTAHRSMPPTAVLGGVDKDGSQIYVGRAYHEGDWIPAKVIPEKHVAYVAYGGGEHAKDTFQVLCEQRFDWVPSSGGNIPPGAVEGGRTESGEPLYIGRVWHDGAHTVGKVHPSHGTCYIPYAMEELSFPDYEILVLRL